MLNINSGIANNNLGWNGQKHLPTRLPEGIRVGKDTQIDLPKGSIQNSVSFAFSRPSPIFQLGKPKGKPHAHDTEF
jgi:hypothetical protein